MKLKSVFFFTILLASGIALAQEEDSVTTEELEVYAWMEDSVLHYKEVQTERYVTAIEENELLKGVYNDIKKAYPDDTTQLKEEEGITSEQIAAYADIQMMYDTIVQSIKDVKIDLIKNEVTVSTYNKVRKQLKSDEKLEATLDSLMQEKKKKWEIKEEDTEE